MIATLFAGALLVPQRQQAPPNLRTNQARLAPALTRDQVAFAFLVQDPRADILAECKRLESSSSLADRQFALYQRARWHHREYELAIKDRPGGAAYLKKNVIDHYDRYESKYKLTSSPYMADTRFYNSIALLEAGRPTDALGEIKNLKTALDPQIELDDIVWAPRREFSVRKTYDSSVLKSVLVAAIDGHMGEQFPDVRVDAVARQVRLWTRYPTDR